MNSKQCNQCSLITFTTSHICKRCQGLTFTEISGEYRPKIDMTTVQPRKNIIGIIRHVFTVIGAVLIVGACFGALILIIDARNKRHTDYSLSPVPALQRPLVSPTHSEEVSKRLQFARGLHAMMQDGEMLNPTARTIGEGESTLVITADDMTEDDCSMFATTTLGGAAKLAGFDLLACRNRRGNEWNRRLFRH